MVEIVCHSESGRTHEVFNQAPPLVDYNFFSSDKILGEALEREGGGWAITQAMAFGELVGSREAISWGSQANQSVPILHTHDRFGNRIDEVEFHLSWHQLMRVAIEHRLHSLPWTESRKGVHVVRAVLMMLAGQNEAGHLCPISMTHAVVPALRKQPDLADRWEPFISARTYDPRLLPVSSKRSAIIGMAMTEKQGGSDVRSNTTVAQPSTMRGSDGEYLVTGHKWFCSAPMSDAFLILARTRQGLSCLLVPRCMPDGRRNNIFIQRLKNKLGNRSNASGEIEFEQATGYLVGEEGRGISTIIEMVNHTRLDCAIVSAALMRQSLVQAIHHCTHRNAFGRALVNQPLMKNVLADLCLESEAATLLMMRLARAYDDKEHNAEYSLARIATAVGKYWLCKRASLHVAEALECLGGNGYVEESVLPRIYREAPVNSIWEGSGNVICLDVLRAMKREPESLEALLIEVRQALGQDRCFDAFVLELEADIKKASEDESQGRRVVEKMALALQGSLFVRYSPPKVAALFCRSRLENNRGHTFGTLPMSSDFDVVINRSWCV